MNRFDAVKEAVHQLSLKEKKTVFKMTENQSYNPGESQWWVTLKKISNFPQMNMHTFLTFSSGSSWKTNYSFCVPASPH